MVAEHISMDIGNRILTERFGTWSAHHKAGFMCYAAKFETTKCQSHRLFFIRHSTLRPDLAYLTKLYMRFDNPYLDLPRTLTIKCVSNTQHQLDAYHHKSETKSPQAPNHEAAEDHAYIPYKSRKLVVHSSYKQPPAKKRPSDLPQRLHRRTEHPPAELVVIRILHIQRQPILFKVHSPRDQPVPARGDMLMHARLGIVQDF